ATELPRNRENAFCCGAGGAQFWKEEEPGDQRISDNRFREAQQTLASAPGEKVLAVGCPFCKSMLGSTPSKADSDDIAIKDVAELLLEGVRRSKGLATPIPQIEPIPTPVAPASAVASVSVPPGAAAEVSTRSSGPTPAAAAPDTNAPAPERKKWQPKAAPSTSVPPLQPEEQPIAAANSQPPTTEAQPAPERKKWQPKSTPSAAHAEPPVIAAAPAEAPASTESLSPDEPVVTARKKWTPKKSS
ncbi:MAG TPA: heterodisulfide reductase-related iron-sulfur binding cluster, partial [Edaphobacter sp.]|nr:heterodisulfide reductase-related iron-sulfur binding cluster [Edaphobacter sp.]